jgi:prepilin-type N-terminal cleavage/methylation domain-containing protein
MTGLPPLRPPARLRLRLAGRQDQGFTLVEMIVTMAVFSVFAAMVTLILVRLMGESSAQIQTLKGLQQAQLAERTFTQYLRSLTTFKYVSGDDIVFQTSVGTSTTGTGSNQIVTSATETIEAELCPTSNSKVDTIEVIFGLPQSGSGSSGLNRCIGADSSSTTTSLPAGVRLVEAFYIEAPVTPIFSFYTLADTVTTPTGTVAEPGLSAITPTPSESNQAAVQAVGLDATFLPPPGPKTEGYDAELGTVVNTVVFLRNREVTGGQL